MRGIAAAERTPTGLGKETRGSGIRIPAADMT
jgi:hypothetical protein